MIVLFVYFIVVASNEPIMSCDNIQINHSVLIIFWPLSRIKFLTRKLKEYYMHQPTDSKNSADLHLQVDASGDCTSLRHSLTNATW